MRLGEICQKIGSGATPTGGKNSYADSGISLIRSQNVLDFAFSYNGLAHINEEQADKLRNVNVLPDDVLLNITGDSVARACMVDEAALPARVNQHVAIVRVDKTLADPYYVMLWLVWQKNRLLSLASNGATRHALTKEMIQELDLSLPSLNAQTRVSRLLHSLDRKIALNRKKIATLEKMAKEIYDYWFVQYDFPDANGRPYKSSGGEMVYSPELKREIPKGWRVGCLGDVVDINKRSHNVRTFPEHINYIDISSTQCGFVGTPTVYSRDEVPGRARRIAVDGDIVWSCVRPNLKAFALILSPKDEDVFSTGFAVLSPREIPNSYLYCVTSADSFVSYLVAKTGNSAYPAVLPGDFKLYQLSLPPSDILEAFHDSAGPLFRRRQRCFDEISKLTALRDFLLPLLMNGQVKVGQ